MGVADSDMGHRPQLDATLGAGARGHTEEQQAADDRTTRHPGTEAHEVLPRYGITTG